jgi:Glycosyl hydrolase family 26
MRSRRLRPLLLALSCFAMVAVAAGVSTIADAPPASAAETTLVARGSTWKYKDNGSKQPSAWKTLAFDDRYFASGKAQLGFGDGDEQTVIRGGVVGDRHIVTFFRQEFQVTNSASFDSLRIDLLVDDGALVWLNGQELARFNLPDGRIRYTTMASSTRSGGAESRFEQLPASAAALRTGTNVIAVQVHQATLDSSDLSFDLGLVGVTGTSGGGGGSGGGSGGGGGSGSGGGAGSVSGKLVPSQGAYLGIWASVRTSSSSASAYKSALLKHENFIGRTTDIGHHYHQWGTKPPEGWRQQWDVDNGRIPMVAWGGAASKDITSGKYDTYIRQRADSFKDFGEPVFLRFFWEADGTYNRSKAGTGSDFIAAWRHVHDIFVNRGANNVVWVWCGTAWGFVTGTAQEYYPGNNYVDWTCADGYNWNKNGKWESFDKVYSAFYAWGLTKGKPMMAGEIGTVEGSSGQKAAWLRDMLQQLKTKYTAMKAIVYFDSYDDRGYNWYLDSSTSSYNAFKEIARDPYFNPPHPSS